MGKDLVYINNNITEVDAMGVMDMKLIREPVDYQADKWAVKLLMIQGQNKKQQSPRQAG